MAAGLAPRGPCALEELALADCLDYLGRRVEEYRLPLKVGDRLRQVLTQALEHFSIGQIYNFIWRAAKDAAAFYQKGGVVRTHAANTVPGSIQRAAERALANGWEVKVFGRDWNAPEGEMLHLLANVVTGAGDLMAWHPPSPVAERARLAPLLEQAADLVGLPIDDVVDGVRDEGTTVSGAQRLVESAAPAVEDARAYGSSLSERPHRRPRRRPHARPKAARCERARRTRRSSRCSVRSARCPTRMPRIRSRPARRCISPPSRQPRLPGDSLSAACAAAVAQSAPSRARNAAAASTEARDGEDRASVRAAPPVSRGCWPSIGTRTMASTVAREGFGRGTFAHASGL